MRLVISNYRGHRITRKNQAIVAVEDGDPKDVLGKTVQWVSPSGKIINGAITKTHGKHSVRVRFTRGIPGQALGTEVKLKTQK